MKIFPTPARDQLLDRWVHDLLEHDPRLQGCRELSLTVDGGVVHVEGTVHAQTDLDCLRELVGRFAGVHAVWDHVRVEGRTEPWCSLDVGVGSTKQHPENLGVDVVAHPGVDIVADLSHGLPLPDDSVDRAYAVHVLEHFAHWLPVADELHRVVRPQGVLHVVSPHWQHVNAVADPTHVSYFDVQTFKQLGQGGPQNRPWRVLHVSYDGASVFADLMPVKDGTPPSPPEQLARFFD